MTDELELDNSRLVQELQELVALEVRDILAAAAEEGFAARDVVSALERALQAEIAALANARQRASDRVAPALESPAADAI